MGDKLLFSEWFRGQLSRTDAVGSAAKVWFAQHGLDRRGRINAWRLTRQAGIEASTAKAVMDEFARA